MGSLSQAKTLGGIGSILTLLLFVPHFVGAALVIIGWIMVLLALKNISDAVQDKSIFTNALVFAILEIIAIVVFAIVVAGAILGFIGLGTLSSTGSTAAASTVFGLIAGLIGGLLVVWVLGLVASYFLWTSFKSVSAKTGVGLFGTVGLIYFIGSILTIILIGFVLTFVAQILFIVAFFSLPDNPPNAPMPPSPPMGPTGPSSA